MNPDSLFDSPLADSVQLSRVNSILAGNMAHGDHGHSSDGNTDLTSDSSNNGNGNASGNSTGNLTKSPKQQKRKGKRKSGRSDSSRSNGASAAAAANVRTAFDCPQSLQDLQWLWRQELQNNRATQQQLSHLSSMMQATAAAVARPAEEGAPKGSPTSDDGSSHGSAGKSSDRRSRSRKGHGTTNHPNKPAIACKSRSSNDSYEIHINCQQLLKFGCPKHDLAVALKKYGYGVPSYLICNGYSVDCQLNNSIDKMREIKAWNFEELGVTFRRFLSAETPLRIQVTAPSSPASAALKSMEFELLRTGEGVFPKKFRPGMYKFDGVCKTAGAKDHSRKKQRSDSRAAMDSGDKTETKRPKGRRGRGSKNGDEKNDNKLGTWFEGKLFYIRQSDTIVIDGTEDGSIKFLFDLHCNLANKKNKDGLSDIIGGIGLCQLSGKHQKHGIRNCLLLRSEETELFQVLQNSTLRVFVDPTKLAQLKDQNVRVNVNGQVLDLVAAKLGHAHSAANLVFMPQAPVQARQGSCRRSQEMPPSLVSKYEDYAPSMVKTPHEVHQGQVPSYHGSFQARPVAQQQQQPMVKQQQWAAPPAAVHDSRYGQYAGQYGQFGVNQQAPQQSYQRQPVKHQQHPQQQQPQPQYVQEQHRLRGDGQSHARLLSQLQQASTYYQQAGQMPQQPQVQPPSMYANVEQQYYQAQQHHHVHQPQYQQPQAQQIRYQQYAPIETPQSQFGIAPPAHHGALNNLSTLNSSGGLNPIPQEFGNVGNMARMARMSKWHPGTNNHSEATSSLNPTPNNSLSPKADKTDLSDNRAAKNISNVSGRNDARLSLPSPVDELQQLVDSKNFWNVGNDLVSPLSCYGVTQFNFGSGIGSGIGSGNGNADGFVMNGVGNMNLFDSTFGNNDFNGNVGLVGGNFELPVLGTMPGMASMPSLSLSSDSLSSNSGSVGAPTVLSNGGVSNDTTVDVVNGNGNGNGGGSGSIGPHNDKVDMGIDSLGNMQSMTEPPTKRRKLNYHNIDNGPNYSLFDESANLNVNVHRNGNGIRNLNQSRFDQTHLNAASSLNGFPL